MVWMYRTVPEICLCTNPQTQTGSSYYSTPILGWSKNHPQALPSVFWRCWLSCRLVKKTEWRSAGVVIYVGWGADLHMAQLMPLSLTVSCSSKSRLVLSFWCQLKRVVLDKGPLNGCFVCCVTHSFYLVTDSWGNPCLTPLCQLYNASMLVKNNSDRKCFNSHHELYNVVHLGVPHQGYQHKTQDVSLHIYNRHMPSCYPLH